MVDPQSSGEAVQPPAADKALWPRILGYSGLLPPLALVLMIAIGPEDRVAATRETLVDYVALIAAFLGGINWGLALKMQPGTQQRDELIYGVTPMLVAWVVLTVNIPYTPFLLPATLVAIYMRHRATAQRDGLPAWFIPLRLHLTLGLTTLYLAGLYL